MKLNRDISKFLCIIIFSSIFFISCGDRKKDSVLKLINEWEGREIIYPSDIKFAKYNGDTFCMDSKFPNYKILTYMDSLDCVSCNLNLSEWVNFSSVIDTISSVSVFFQFVFQPHRVNELLLTLKRDDFLYPIYIDKKGSFDKLNNFPDNLSFRTFLLDKNNRVVAIGNPTRNPKVKELYISIIRGKVAAEKVKTIQTKVEIKEQDISLGYFKWQEEQMAEYVIHNVGKQILVINDVTSSCECTSINYSKKPISPGDSISLRVTYKADHPEHFNKTITVYCNSESSPIRLKISGNAE